MLRENDTGSLGAGGGLFWQCGEWFYGTMAGPWWYHGTARAARGCQVPFSVLRMLIQATPNRGQKSEYRIRPPKPPPCDINATPMRVASQAVATPKPPQCDPKATLKPP